MTKIRDSLVILEENTGRRRELLSKPQPQNNSKTVAGSVLTDDDPGYFKGVPSGEILEEDSESGEGFEDEQEICQRISNGYLYSQSLN